MRRASTHIMLLVLVCACTADRGADTPPIADGVPVAIGSPMPSVQQGTLWHAPFGHPLGHAVGRRGVELLSVVCCRPRADGREIRAGGARYERGARDHDAVVRASSESRVECRLAGPAGSTGVDAQTA